MVSIRKELLWSLVVGAFFLVAYQERQRFDGFIRAVEYKLDRWNASDESPRAQPVTENHIECCLCSHPDGPDISTYTSYSLCEFLNRTLYRNCKKISVLGTSCSFVVVENNGYELNFRSRSIEYIEAGVLKSLPPPDGILTLYELSRARTLEGETEDEVTSASASSYWTCGSSTASAEECQAMLVEHGVATYISKKRNPHPPDGCARQICSRLFSKEFAPLSPLYVHDQLLDK